ncbi:glycosyltransferase family 9 protein [Mucilaginibacter gotjawali]|uniref:ADP-heptose--LPS heptosyltransferase 2 n=2 Tax=Mucilaginibacter gotjawali TaxID=1550579 RepID=A0A110B093_9SPHI|nr:glycosyltransferase family 9 protein [Mucilaginibacter gotjawali]MBB3057519.1 lipopolysaccharide heptosyltransferase II [Mucilaginibacter gotjawali]BAU55360.1 ADP-heptose--LPS heptosyltransferase 2 [Mucilaginibacter gotjawali]
MLKVSNLKSQTSNLKILIRLPNWLGDVVMSTAFVSAVRELYPASSIDVIIKKELAGIASLVPGLRKVHSFSKQENKGLAGVFRFGKKMRTEQYDLFFNLPESLSSLVMGWATGAKQRVGFGKEGGFFLLTHHYKKPKNIHRVDEYISLLEQFTGKTISNRQVSLQVQKPGKPITDWVLVNFNSEASSRRMPIEKAKSLLNLLTNHFKEVEFTFVGAPKEAPFIDEIINGAENIGRIRNFAGKTDLVSLTHLMAGCTAMITTDSGPAHLANSVNTPVIVLFGAGNEHNTAPYNTHNLTVLRAGKLDCEPCVKNTCKLYGIPKCMQLLDDLLIINALSVYLPHA